MHEDKPASVLIVDDDASVLKAAGIMLMDAGYNAVLCGNAPKAIRRRRAWTGYCIQGGRDDGRGHRR